MYGDGTTQTGGQVKDDTKRVKYSVDFTVQCSECDQDIKVGYAGPKGIKQHQGSKRCRKTVAKNERSKKRLEKQLKIRTLFDVGVRKIDGGSAKGSAPHQQSNPSTSDGLIVVQPVLTGSVNPSEGQVAERKTITAQSELQPTSVSASHTEFNITAQQTRHGRRTRDMTELTACICGHTVAQEERTTNSTTAMQCAYRGCETSWVRMFCLNFQHISMVALSFIWIASILLMHQKIGGVKIMQSGLVARFVMLALPFLYENILVLVIEGGFKWWESLPTDGSEHPGPPIPN